MRRNLAALIITSLLTGAVVAQNVKHVVLITIDGLRPEFYLDSTWGMHTIQHMMQEGASAKQVESVYQRLLSQTTPL